MQMTGKDASPTTKNQQFATEAGQASRPVDAFFRSLTGERMLILFVISPKKTRGFRRLAADKTV
jgi:hypothetical protein